MQTFNSIYLGIVVQNNDPERRGRVKVWVPHISTTIYSKWNQVKQDHTFSFPGTPGGEGLSAIIEDLKDVLPWAEYSSPIVGASSTGYYNNRFDVNTVSDAPLVYGQPGTNTTSTSLSTNIEPENKGGKKGAYWEHNPIGDAFSNTSKINSQYVNPNAYSYIPSTYSNAAKGIFSIPNVGAHVWVFFRDGVPQYPVYVGASLGQEDFNSIFKDGEDSEGRPIYTDYPATFENKDKRAQPDINADTVTYRNKLVINQRGAAIEIINTTDRERYKVTHFSGSFHEMNSKYTSMFNTGNLQLLTVRDKFETVSGHNNTYTGRDRDDIIQGDHFIKVGILDTEAATNWSNLMKEITTGAASDPGKIEQLLTDATPSLANAEKTMGFGGNSFEFIAKHKTVTVGLTVNTASVLDEEAGVYDLVTGVIPGSKVIGIFREIGLLNVPDMPGGNYDIFATNRFSAKSGAGGASVETTGQLKLSGVLTDIRGQQVNVGGDVVDINAGLVKIQADTLYLKNKNNTQVVVDSNLGVVGNVVIGGAAHINGELYVNHITAPYELQATESSTIQATNGRWGVIGCNITGTANPPPSLNAPWVINIKAAIITDGILNINAPHSHSFKNVPLTLLPSSTLVAAAASETTKPSNEPVAVTAPIQIPAVPKLNLPLLPPFPKPNGFIKLPWEA